MKHYSVVSTSGGNFGIHLKGLESPVDEEIKPFPLKTNAPWYWVINPKKLLMIGALL